MPAFTESTVESAALGWLEAGDWQVAHGRDLPLDMPGRRAADDGERCWQHGCAIGQALADIQPVSAALRNSGH
jgi:hypothetical protein